MTNKKVLALLLAGLLPFSLIADRRIAVNPGNWSDKSVWDGDIPGEGDTIAIRDGVTVTVGDERIIGTAGSAGTVAIELGKDGRLVIAKGGLLKVRGDAVYAAVQTGTAQAVVVNGGGVWRWDSSKSPSPKTTHYAFRPDRDFGYRPFVLSGTPESPACLDSSEEGAEGVFSKPKAFGGPFISEYGRIVRIGDEEVPGWDIGWYITSGTSVVWDVRHTTFSRCGLIKITAGGMDGNAVFRHDDNVHADTRSKTVFSAFAGGGKLTGGTREIMRNVFDVAAAGQTLADGYTICGNYFGGGLNILWQSEPWAKCEGNFHRIFGQWCWVAGKKLSDSVCFIDRDLDNPHVIFGTKKYHTELDGLILSHAGTANTDSGEWVFSKPGATRCIFLPNQYGYSSCEIAATGGSDEGPFIFEHNTWFGGFERQRAAPGYPGFAAFQYSETGNSRAGVVKSFRSNIMWNPQLPGKEASFCKMNDVHSMDRDQKDGPPVADVGNPADIDFNTGWNCTPDKDIDFKNKGHYKNWGKGYVGNWSRTPGEHDVDADPQFVDYRRDVQLFATKCLGMAPSRGKWESNPSRPYAVGDTVLNTTGILWGEPVLYRYLGGGGNPEPGAGNREKGDRDQWRNSWEWGSLHAIREGVRTQRKFGGDDIIMHLIKWMREGYAPANPALKGKAHDGGDIGAVPCGK